MSDLPAPGIYFGMPEEEYHQAPALSNSGIKNLRVSSMIFWARSWLNPHPVRKESGAMELGKAYDCRIIEGKTAFYQRYAQALDPEQYQKAARTIDDLKDLLPASIKPAKRKGELIEQVLEYEPDALIWDRVVEEHARRNEGKALLTAETLARIEIAAAMIERDPELCKAFTGGYPQVSIFWECPETGVPMKARLDYLKVRAIVDLKTFGNAMDRPVDHAIFHAMANQKYHIQAVVYQEAVAMAKRLPAFGNVSEDWLLQFQKAPPPNFMFVFQMTGEAPVTRGKVFPAELMTSEVGKVVVKEMKEKFKNCLEHYGDAPWLDVAPISNFADEDFPQRMTME